MASDRPAREGSSWVAAKEAWTLALAALFLLVFAAAALRFGAIQNIWIDESTQLSGATLGPSELIRWLAGGEPARFGVPDDRMPPISYLIDSACFNTVCGAPESFRLLHLFIAALGLTTILLLMARRYGLAGTAVTGLVLALSPKLIEAAVEVRAYPIFFTLTALQIALFFHCFDRDRLDGPLVAGLALLGVLASYTHFFGLVSTMALFAGLLLCRAASRRDAVLVIGAGAAVLIVSAGLKPFITGASSISGVEQVPLVPAEFALYLLRLAGHPATMLWTPAAMLFLLPLWLLVAWAVLRSARAVLRDPAYGRIDPIAGLTVALLAGLAVTMAAALAVKGFNPLKPSYSIWMLPVLAVIAGAAAAELRGWARLALAVPLAVGAVWTLAAFTWHARWFVHGPSSLIAEQLAASPRPVAVVYRGAWGMGFFPSWYRFGPALDQWTLDPDGSLHRIGRGGAPAGAVAPAEALDRYRRVLLVDIELKSFRDLRTSAGSSEAALPAQPSPSSQPALASWTPVAVREEPGLYAARLTTLEKRSRP